MNTLNNIHALVDIDPALAKASIIRLSRLMRYLLYEGDKPTVTLQRGIDFLCDYVDLMRMRYSDKVDITLNVPEQVPQVSLPPLLVVPFVENAFKHGVSYTKHSFIQITVAVNDRLLTVVCHNSKPSCNEGLDVDRQEGGIGLPNVKKRLKLLYGHRYQLVTRDDICDYEVTLELPIDDTHDGIKD